MQSTSSHFCNWPPMGSSISPTWLLGSFLILTRLIGHRLCLFHSFDLPKGLPLPWFWNFILSAKLSIGIDIVSLPWCVFGCVFSKNYFSATSGSFHNSPFVFCKTKVVNIANCIPIGQRPICHARILWSLDNPPYT